MYGQINYNEKLGNGSWRISQIGCFLTAMCNLAKRFGNDVNPLRLNAYFRDNRLYLPDDDGSLQLLSWWTVSGFDPSIVVKRTGRSVPPSNNCIVKFNYVSNNGQTNLHFCLVESVADRTIVDSWDGRVKSWDTYGGPVEWAEYVDNTPNATPQVVAPIVTSSNFDGNAVTVLPGWGLSDICDTAGIPNDPTHWQMITDLNGGGAWQDFNAALSIGQRVVVKGKVPTPAPAPTPVVTGSETVEVQRGWGLGDIAAAAGFDDAQSPERWTNIASLNGSAVWQDFNARLVTGQVVRVRPAPVAPAAPEPAKPVAETTQEALVKVKVAPSYKESYKPEQRQYVASKSVVVKDVDGLSQDIQLVKEQKVSGAGTFIKDGATYVRTVKSVEKDRWYGIPVDALTVTDGQKYVGKLVTTDDDLTTAELASLDISLEAKEFIHNLSSREKLVAIVGKVMSIFNKSKNGRNKK